MHREKGFRDASSGLVDDLYLCRAQACLIEIPEKVAKPSKLVDALRELGIGDQGRPCTGDLQRHPI